VTHKTNIYSSSSENRMSLLCSKAQDGVISAVERRQGRLFEAVGKENKKNSRRKEIKVQTQICTGKCCLSSLKIESRGVTVKKKILDISNRIKVSFYVRTDKARTFG
jgi:hypothetical protein